MKEVPVCHASPYHPTSSPGNGLMGW